MALVAGTQSKELMGSHSAALGFRCTWVRLPQGSWEAWGMRSVEGLTVKYAVKEGGTLWVISLIFKSNLSAFFLSFFFFLWIWKQVDDLLHMYGSAADGVSRDNAWEVQTYVHFQDNQGVSVTIKPEHRVEDILTLACKVMGFAAEICFWRKMIINVAFLCLLNLCGV